ncbi:MAG TPA: hypothetical protein PLF40_06090 [Kofleriaceae bacterium]|nr:hypothetical protein [Kofleriaceae bacterium]
MQHFSKSCLIGFAAIVNNLPSASADAIPAPTEPNVLLEASVLWPAMTLGKFYSFQALLPLTNNNNGWRGQLAAGVGFRLAETTDDRGTLSSAGVRVGWRQYVVRGAHIDLGLAVIRASLKNAAFDGRNDTSYNVETQATVGYEFRWREFGLVIQPAGIGYAAFRSSPFPRANGDNDEPPFFVANILINYAL